jgi:hypothetical protein
MKAAIIVILLLVLGYGFVQGLKVYKMKGDFGARVERELNFVDNNSMDAAKQDLVQEAQKFGIELTPDNIRIAYEDTEQRSVAQQLVGNKLGTQFTNKRITINVHYTARILGLPFGQDITSSKIKQAEAPRMPVPPSTRELLDSTGASALPTVQ